MPPYRTQIIENSHAERDDRGDVELHPQLVTEVGQPRRQGRIREEAAEENARLERARDVRLERSENGVERREQRDRRVAGIGDRDREWRHEAEQHPQEREQDRDDNYLPYPTKMPHGLGGFALSPRGPLSEASPRVGGDPFTCTPALPATAMAGARQAMAMALQAAATYSLQPAPTGSSR